LYRNGRWLGIPPANGLFVFEVKNETSWPSFSRGSRKHLPRLSRLSRLRQGTGRRRQGNTVTWSSIRSPMFPEDRAWLLAMAYPGWRRDRPTPEPVHYDLPEPTVHSLGDGTPLGARRLGE